MRPSGHNVLYYLYTAKTAQLLKKQSPAFPEYIWNRQHMMIQPPQAHNHGKYGNYGKGWYFRFHDDNKMSYEYIISIT